MPPGCLEMTGMREVVSEVEGACYEVDANKLDNLRNDLAMRYCRCVWTGPCNM